MITRESPAQALAFSSAVHIKHLAPCKLVVPDRIDKADKVLLFIHGLEGGASTFSDVRQECAKQGIATLTFDYPNDGPTKQAAAALRHQLGELSNQYPDLRLAVVAHSLGGLVAILAVSDPEFPPDLVTDVFTLGTPFQGSALAEFQVELELINVAWRLFARDPGAIDIMKDGHGEAADDIRPDSQLLRQLQGQHLPTAIRFHVAAGSRSFLSDKEREMLRRELPREMKRLRISPDYRQKLERFINADETRNGISDGAVTIASATALHSPHCKKVFDATHLGLVCPKTSDKSGQVFKWIVQEMNWYAH